MKNYLFFFFSFSLRVYFGIGLYTCTCVVGFPSKFEIYSFLIKQNNPQNDLLVVPIKGYHRKKKKKAYILDI